MFAARGGGGNGQIAEERKWQVGTTSAGKGGGRIHAHQSGSAIPFSAEQSRACTMMGGLAQLGGPESPREHRRDSVAYAGGRIEGECGLGG